MMTQQSIATRIRTLSLTIAGPALAATMTFAAATSAHAGNPCTSEWMKFKSFFDTNGPKIAKGICQLFNKDDAAAAQKCVDDYERTKAKVDETITKYNAQAGDSSAKIGPRGLGEGQWATGTLLAERTFAGPAVMSDSYRLQLERTGGKATNQMKGTVCFLDDQGNAALAPVSFAVDRNNVRFDRTFTGVAGLTPVILLEKPFGLNGHQYRIHGQSGAEPAIVAAARKVQGGGCQPCPKGGSFDGANCYIGAAPTGTKAFLYAGNYYYTAVNRTCPLSGSRFDGANCLVSKAPDGTKPFIYANNWYYENMCK
ncbi:MAG: hypothetical protein R3B09_01120 [Nannocystaceae bacterium]